MILIKSAQTMNYTVVINCAVWGGALLYYYIDARKWFTGPKITIDTADLSAEQEQEIRASGLIIEGLEKKTSNSNQDDSGSGEDSHVDTKGV